MILSFIIRCFSRRNEPDDISIITLTVTSEQHVCFNTHSKHQKAVFGFDVILLKELLCKFNKKYGSSFPKGNSVFLTIVAHLATLHSKLIVCIKYVREVGLSK